MKFFKNKLAVTVVVLSVLFLFLMGYTAKRKNVSIVEGSVGTILNPVQGVIYNFNNKIKDSFSFVINFSKVKEENEQLTKRNNELESKALAFDGLKSENDRLREALDFKDKNSIFNYKGCDILNRSGGGFLDEFTINKGSKDGIKKGMVVITPKGLIGQVTSTASNWSIVQSLANENIAVGGANQNNSGIVKGYKDSNNNMLAKIYLLPQNADIKKDDVIFTSGDGGVYPKGIKIGYVLSVEEDKAKLTKTALIQPYINYNKLDEVYVVIPTENTDEITKYQGEIK
jgi:rod shape-determining protein MreC